MKQTFRLKVVQDLAQQQSDGAATRLGFLNAEAVKAEQKLEMLLEYREDYRERFRSSLHSDVHSAAWQNFQQFLQKLDEAIEQQRVACVGARQAVLGGKRDWQSRQMQVKAYDTLAQRHDSVCAERLKRIDQRVMDEFAARVHHQKG
jgi:flagellar FliJ protein